MSEGRERLRKLRKRLHETEEEIKALKKVAEGRSTGKGRRIST